MGARRAPPPEARRPESRAFRSRAWRNWDAPALAGSHVTPALAAPMVPCFRRLSPAVLAAMLRRRRASLGFRTRHAARKGDADSCREPCKRACVQGLTPQQVVHSLLA